MNPFWNHHYPLLAGLLLVGLGQRWLPAARAEEPRWFKLNGVPEASVGLEVESSTETARVGGGGESTYEHLFLTPLVGLRTAGSIYHPNLLAFALDGELGWGWDQMTTRSSGVTQTRNETGEFNRYLAQINLLPAKPYNASFFAAQDHTYRDYGTFDTFTVDSERYGGRMNWNTEHLSLNADFGYRDEKSSGLNSSSEITETYFNFVGLNRRQHGQTTLNVRVNQFDNYLNFGNQFTTLNESVGISDSETFGQRQQITAAAGASYSHSEYGGQQTENLNATANVTVNHRPNLDSFFVMDFTRNQLRPITDDRVQGVVGVRHQLYESLASNFDVHGSHQENSGDVSSSTSDRVGLGLSENYTKRLRSWGRLSVGAGIIVDHEEDHATGSTLTSLGESHQLYLPTSPQYRPVYLSRPRVNAASIQVDVAGDVLVPASDYEVVSAGELTEVRLLVPASSHLQSLLQTNDNLTVSVTYQSDSLNNAAFDSLNASFQIRLDLPNHIGIYGRLNWMDNNAPPQALVQTLTDLVAGVDYNWRWLRTGAEYESYESNFSKYQALRFYQDFNFQLDDRSTLSLNLNETFYAYAGNRNHSQYRLLARYSARLGPAFAWYVEGGGLMQDVMGTRQFQGSARTGLNWTRGKLSVRAGYEFNTQMTSNGPWTEEREKIRLFAYLKRTF